MSLECNYSSAQKPVGSAVKASCGCAYLYIYEVSLCLMKQYAMKAFWGVKIWLMHSQPHHQMDIVHGQLHAANALPLEKETLLTTGQADGWNSETV